MITTRIKRGNWFFYLLLFVCIITPQDRLNIKIPLLLIALLADLLLWHGSLKNRKALFVALGMGILFPVLSIVASLAIGGANIRDIISQAYPSVIMVFLVMNQRRIHDYKRIFYFACRILVVLILVICLLDLLHIQSVNSGVFQAITQNLGIGGIIKLNDSLFGYKVFLYASPLIIFLLDDDFQNHRIGWVLASCVALFLTGTRANMLAMLLYVFYGLYFQKGNQLFSNRNVKIALRVLVAVLLCVFAGRAISRIVGFFSNETSVASNDTKTLQVKYILEQLGDIKTLFLGRGLSSPVLDPARGIYTTSVEMMFFYYLYEIGIILFAVFFFFMVYPVFSKIETHYKIAYIGFLLSALTNPILTTSTSYMAFLLVYTMIAKRSTMLEIVDYV